MVPFAYFTTQVLEYINFKNSYLNRTMSIFETMRAMLHVGNDSLAAYFEVSPLYMKLVASNSKELGSKKQLAALELFQQLVADEARAAVPETEAAFLWQAADEAAVQRLIRKKQRILERKQEELVTRQQQRQQWLQGLAACRQLLAKDSLAAHQRKWLALREKHLQQYIQEKASLRQLKLLKAEIAALTAQLDCLREADH